jgi:cytochrome c553
MMWKTLKRIGLGLLGLIGLVVLLVFVLSEVRWNSDYHNFDVSVETIQISNDEAAVARGEHIATIHYCGHCHGENLAGGYLLNEPVLAVVAAPNLTAGVGGFGASNSDEDWVRAIRHGIGHDGRGLIGMPSRLWHQLREEDLTDLLAYLKSIPPVDNQMPQRKIGPLFRVMLALGKAPLTEARLIDHDTPFNNAPTPGVTLEYGEYLALGCTGCHGSQLNGGMARDFDGELVVAQNLTPGGALASWTEAQFIQTLRTGVTPTGREFNDLMPWQYVGQMTDEEIQAVWLYLQSIPALEQGTERSDL